MKPDDPPQPAHSPTDSKVKRIRERTMDLIADATVHAQRIDDAARRLGLTPDLVDGLGDEIYDAAVTQLDVASKILERSTVLVDRLLDLGLPRQHRRSLFHRVPAKVDESTQIYLDVANTAEQTATVKVEVVPEPPPKNVVPTVQIGQESLRGGRETAVEILIAPIKTAGVYPLVVKVSLVYPGGRRHALPENEYEIWVR